MSAKGRKKGPLVDAPDIDTLRQLLKSRELTLAELAFRSGLSAREINALLQKGARKKVFLHTIKSLSTGLDIEDHELYGSTRARDGTPSELSGHRVSIDGVTRQEWKNVIVDESIRQRILSTEKMPSFAECIRATRTFPPLDDQHKDYPFDPNSHYNHFLQAAAVISIEKAEEGAWQVLAYQRSPRPGLSQYEHTRGNAILWGASFSYNLARPPWSEMDKWMEKVKTRASDAKMRFTAEVGSVLMELPDYKIDLRDLPLQIEPFAVITNDQRTERDHGSKGGRVYTQFVFHVRFSSQALEMSSEPDVGKRDYGTPWCCLSEQAMPYKALRDCFSQGGKLNVMDVLAWKGMFVKKHRIAIEKATFTKGFVLI